MKGHTRPRSHVVDEKTTRSTAVVRTRDGTEGFGSRRVPACREMN